MPFEKFEKPLIPPTEEEIPETKEEEIKEITEASEAEFREEVLDREKGFLEKFRGKTKQIANVMMLVSALSFGPGIAKEVFAAEKGGKPEMTDIEKEKSREQKAVDFLHKLYSLPDNPKAVNPAQNQIMKERAARSLIQFYALEKKGQVSGQVTPEDIKEALQELNNASGLFADRHFGNNDGKTDPEEMNKLNEEISKNAGLHAFTGMSLQFSK